MWTESGIWWISDHPYQSGTWSRMSNIRLLYTRGPNARPRPPPAAAKSGCSRHAAAATISTYEIVIRWAITVATCYFSISIFSQNCMHVDEMSIQLNVSTRLQYTHISKESFRYYNLKRTMHCALWRQSCRLTLNSDRREMSPLVQKRKPFFIVPRSDGILFYAREPRQSG